MVGLVKKKPGPGHVAIEDVPEPTAGPGQVKIRVECAGVCGSDFHILHWDIKLNLRPPVIMGHEFCGVVECIGEGVTSVAIGDRVTAETTFKSCGCCAHCRTGSYNLCPLKELIGYVHNGCFAPYCVVPAERVHRLPEDISFREGALCEPLACCVHAVMEQAAVRPQECVVVAGVGAIGLLCAQVARAAGAEVILCGTGGDTQRFATARKLAFHQLVNVSEADPVEAVQAATNGRAADLYLECSGAAPSVAAGIALLRRGGKYCQVGLIGAPLQVDFEQIAYKELIVTGSIGSKWTSWIIALDLLRSGKVSTAELVGEPLPLKDWQEAFRRFQNRAELKVLLSPRV